VHFVKERIERLIGGFASALIPDFGQPSRVSATYANATKWGLVAHQAGPSTIELLLQAQRFPEYPRAVRSEDEIPQDLRRHPASQQISFPTLARTYPTYDSPTLVVRV
jgi:hypothetical protein